MIRTLFATVIGLAACGTDTPSTDLSTPTGMVDAYVARLCPKAYACRAEFPADSVLTFDQLFGKSLEDCTDSFTFEPKSGLDASVEAGRVVYQPKDAELCLASLSSSTCSALFGDDPFDLVFHLPSLGGCTTTFTPKVIEGGACAIDLDCVGELACESGRCANK